MKQISNSGVETLPALTVGRTGLRAFLLAILRPDDAKGATLHSNNVTLDLLSKSLRISFGQIERIDVKKGWFGHSVRMRLTDAEKTVSGLTQRHAHALADGLEAARVYWWKKTLETQKASLQSVYAGILHLANPVRYIRFSAFSRLEKDAAQVVKLFPKKCPEKLLASDDVKKLKLIRAFVQSPDNCRARTNATFVKKELERSRGFFDRIEARPLTDEQRKAVVIDEDHNLVVAAAGSGKTSVIVAKAGWLIEKGYRKPSELLLLAYAKDAQTEMEERIRRRLGDVAASKLSVRTFHGLGLSIIGEAEGKRPSLAKVAEDDRALFEFLKSVVVDLLEDQKFSNLMITWFQNHFAPYRSETEFRNQGEYWNYIRANEIRSLKGEKLKSFEECEIANFLFLNGVPYEYERQYEHETATSERRQYQPDFYLPKVGIYIEHFALSASGDTPPFIDRDEYNRSRQWKLDLHRAHGTTLIETYSHEKSAGNLTRNLAKKLNGIGVELSPVPPEEVFKILQQQGRVDPFTHLVATFLQHFKGAQLSIDEIAKRATRSRDRPRAEAFVKVFAPIFQRYEGLLASSKQIDFHDMIVRATNLVECGRYVNPTEYILVDEFQDISPGRSRLLKAILDRSPNSQLFAVGDDWQAIYRFAGSDITIMREFSGRFGASERIDLRTTFRCAQPIASAASKFVLENPAQLRKEVSSTRQINGPGLSIGLSATDGCDLLEKALQSIDNDASKFGEPASVLVLGRYRHSRPKHLAQLAKAHPNLDASYMTVHASKGLEADYVIVVGLCSGKYGFPTEIADDPLLDLVLAAPEGHPNAEERRLFYVAMTRAKRRVFLLADGGPASPFIKELLNGEYSVSVFGHLPEKDVACPTCIEGLLERREGKRGPFYGCSNRPYCRYTQSACPHCLKGLPVKSSGGFLCRECAQPIEGCPSCDGWLQKKNGKFGLFLSCSKWPNCKYTRKAT
jgi:DNA helicase-4